MRFIPIGIASGNEFPGQMKASDFSDGHFDGVQLRKGQKDNAVIIMHSKDPAPYEWKVAYGFSQIFFSTLEEAVAYCEEHGMKLLKGER